MGTASYLRDERLYRPLPLHILSVGQFNGGPLFVRHQGAGGLTDSTWAVNDLAIYMPISLPSPFTVARFMVFNGGNATGNVDVGLFSLSGSKLISTGTTARSGTSQVQYIGVTDQSFNAGHYYLGLVASSTTGSFFRAAFAVVTEVKLCGYLEEQLASTVLPTTMAPTGSTRRATFFGFTQSDSL